MGGALGAGETVGVNEPITVASPIAPQILLPDATTVPSTSK